MFNSVVKFSRSKTFVTW